MAKNPPVDTGVTVSIPGLGRSHKQVGSCTTTIETQAPYSQCSAAREDTAAKPTHHIEGVAPTCCNKRKPTRSSQDPAQQKINLLKKKNGHRVGSVILLSHLLVLSLISGGMEHSQHFLVFTIFLPLTLIYTDFNNSELL